MGKKSRRKGDDDYFAEFDTQEEEPAQEQAEAQPAAGSEYMCRWHCCPMWPACRCHVKLQLVVGGQLGLLPVLAAAASCLGRGFFMKSTAMYEGSQSVARQAGLWLRYSPTMPTCTCPPTALKT